MDYRVRTIIIDGLVVVAVVAAVVLAVAAAAVVVVVVTAAWIYGNGLPSPHNQFYFY